MNRWYGMFLAILLFGGGWLWYSRVPEGTTLAVRPPEPAVNHPAPEFTLTNLRGGASLNLADLRGRPIVLNFWASWCGPCRDEMPILQATHQRYSDSVLVIGVDQGEPEATVQAFVDEFGLTFHILLDQDMAVGDRYRVMGLPTTFFIDRNGTIRKIWTGEMNSAILAEGIQEIIP